MAAQQDFAAVPGGPSVNIDYGNDSVPASGYLLLPDPSDDLATTARKLQALAGVVKTGKSLAVATGYRGAARQERDPTLLAKESMTPQMLMQFEAWMDGATIPAFDLEKNKKAVTGGAGSVARFAKRAVAMNTIWKVKHATSEHASWLTSNMVYALPLVIAVTKVHAAERDLVGGQTALSAQELAEIQTSRRAIAIAMKNMDRVLRDFDRVSSDLNDSMEVLQTREHSIKSKIANYEQKKESHQQFK